MREIKFRVWSLTEKRFIHRFFISNGFSQVWKIEGEIDSLEVYPLPDVIVQQFTGLLDKNNVPIYEGDILRYEYTQADMCSFAALESAFRTYIDYIAEFINGSFVAKPIEYSQYDSPLADCIRDLEIVGNIFQNPELLR